MILYNISVVWKICTHLSDNRFSCGLTQHCLGEHRLEIWILIRAGWVRKYLLSLVCMQVFPKDLEFPELIWTVNRFAVFQFTRHCGVVAALTCSPATIRTVSALHSGCRGSTVVSLTARLWALVIHFIWQLTRAVGLKTYFTFAGWGKTFDSVWSVKSIKGLAFWWCLSASRWQERVPYLYDLRFMSAKLESTVYLFDLVLPLCRCTFTLEQVGPRVFLPRCFSMSLPVKSSCARTYARTRTRTHSRKHIGMRMRRYECWSIVLGIN